MSKKLTYKITGDGCNIQIEYSNGNVIGGKIYSYEFYCNCTAVKVIVGGHIVDLEWNSYVGSESFEEWKALFSCSDSAEETELEKTFEGTDWYTDNNENVPDCDKTLIAIDKWLLDSTWCYVLNGQDISDANNLIDINNYTMKNEFSLGNVNIDDPVCVCALVQYTAPTGGGAVTKDRATILADTVAKLGLTAPAGQTWDLQNSTVAVYSKGTDVTDFTTQVETTTIIDADSDVTCGAKSTTVNVNGGKIPFGNDPIDLDCNGESDNLLAADYAVSFDEGSAVATYNCLTLVAV